MLDRSAGACRVYAHLPLACRTYGFYVQRNKGLYSKDIESRVADGDWAEVVWGAKMLSTTLRQSLSALLSAQAALLAIDLLRPVLANESGLISQVVAA